MSISPKIKEQILQLAKVKSRADVAKHFNIKIENVYNIISQEKVRKRDQKRDERREKLKLRREKVKNFLFEALDTDIQLEFLSLTQSEEDKEKAQNDLIDKFADEYGITLSIPLKNETPQNKSEFLDFLRSKAFELC